MPVSLQPYIELTTSRRRFFEAYSPSAGCRLFIKRSATIEEATKKRNRAGAPADALVQRSISSLQNEALALTWIRQNTKIPVPNIFACYEDRGCFYLIEDYAEDCIPATRSEKHLHPYISNQLETVLEELHRCRSSKLCSFTDQLHLPARMAQTKTFLSHLQYPEDERERYVLCHGDLGWQNVMVHPETGEIKAIIDWEFAGFWPVEIEGQYWRRFGTASAFRNEVDDVDSIAELLYNLSVKGYFEEDYKSPHVEDMERLPYPHDQSPASNAGGSAPHTAAQYAPNNLADEQNSHGTVSIPHDRYHTAQEGDQLPVSDLNDVQLPTITPSRTSESHDPRDKPELPKNETKDAGSSPPRKNHKKSYKLPGMIKRLFKRRKPVPKADPPHVTEAAEGPANLAKADAQILPTAALNDESSPRLQDAPGLPSPLDDVHSLTTQKEVQNNTQLGEEHAQEEERLSKNMQAIHPNWAGLDDKKYPLIEEKLESGDVPEWSSLNVTLPSNGSIVSRTLAVQVAIAARHKVAGNSAALGRAIQVDQHATKDWLAAMVNHAPEYYRLGGGEKESRSVYEGKSIMAHVLIAGRSPADQLRRGRHIECLHLLELDSLLVKPLSTLSKALTESAAALGRFQERQLLDMATDEQRMELDPNFAERAHKFVPSTVFEEANWSNPIDREGDLIKRDIHGDRDIALRDSQTIKWEALRKAAEEILIITHTACSLLPYLPDRNQNQKSRFLDETRACMEDKARDMILGGIGGWLIKVEHDDNWEPIDHHALGVPDEVNRDPETEIVGDFGAGTSDV
ncbi:uncharacterized protein I303_105229 [Kwoniella dejecticola CBS 10117]|uniref:Aminoglycoside phosphotransferase domain-containing protein n=1 Tax=Kwoniella dejecticola CBS 10117 TaxID=1296121 RepID=A0A1A6A331_9TREE|nr:uncharacterized protein I303_05324 [Kwoniella dejecticola CBS 10117]OBR84466.1 hypothetical protein I303_05324 [Kwoniella dejecticola CBS 10117]